jgi:hypothetical protein
MTNDELLEKLLARLNEGVEGLVLDAEELNEEYEEDTDDFTLGYIAGIKYVISDIEFVLDKTISL